MSQGADDNGKRMEFDYAWGWFQYHASQRLTAFNFFLVIVGFLLVGYAQAVDHDWKGLGFGLGAFGAFVALAFLMLDIRNAALVRRGKDALETLEEERMSFSLVTPHAHILTKHKLWLRLITSLAAVGFALAATWAACDYPGSGSGSVACRESSVLVLHRPGFDLNLVKRSEREGVNSEDDSESRRPGHSSVGGVRTGSTRGVDRKLVENGRHCVAKPSGSG
jgi:hypothetical protein